MLEYVGVFKSLLTIVDWFKKLFKEKEEAESKEEETIVTRFIQLFENHGVHRNQIPRFFGHGLSVASVQSNEQLVELLTEEVLADACSLFAVRREWLDGADSDIYEERFFYKRPENFVTFIDDMLKRTDASEVDAVLLVPKEKGHLSDAVIIFQERVRFVGDTPINRFYISEEWPYAGVKSCNHTFYPTFSLLC
ncbi:MAG: hypothetical protein Q9N62_01485 [Ghiorsea sp.]|nr:hypothetical protein [Ghiorsea sp.]